MDIQNFISPKQLIEIKNEIVEQALAFANPILALEYRDGIAILAENPSESLNKMGELYDRIAFAGTGVYNDYERLRRAGVQFADVKGFSYSRRDVKAKGIATEFSAILGDIFSHQQMPWEVEILVAEVGMTAEDNRLFVIRFSGGLVEERRFCALGDIFRDKDGNLKKSVLRKKLGERNLTGAETLEEAFRAGYDALTQVKEAGARLKPENIEMLLLDRSAPRERKVRRLTTAEIAALVPAA